MTTGLDFGFAFEPTMEERYVDVEAKGCVADDLVDIAHEKVVVADMSERGAG